MNQINPPKVQALLEMLERSQEQNKYLKQEMRQEYEKIQNIEREH